MSCSCRRRRRLNESAMVSKVSTTLGLSSASMAASESEPSMSSSSKSDFGGGLARILLLGLLVAGGRRRLEGRGGRGGRRRRLGLHHLQMRRATGDRLAVGAERRRRHLLGVGAGIGRFQVDDVAQEDLALVELVAPDDDGLEGERALAQAGDHGLAAGLDALGDGDLALAREQLDRAHLAQIHAHGIVGALGGFLLLGGGDGLGRDLDQFAVIIVVIALFIGLFVAVFAVIVVLDDGDAHLGDHGEDVFDLVGGDLFRRQNGVDLVVGDVAALFRGLDHLLDAGIAEVEQRQRAVGRAFGLLLRRLVLGLRRLCLARHLSSLLDLLGRRRHLPRAPTLCALSRCPWPKRAAPSSAAPNQVMSVLGTRLSSD